MTEPTIYECVSDRYDPGGSQHYTLQGFQEMCVACFGERATLTRDGADWRDETEQVVLREAQSPIPSGVPVVVSAGRMNPNLPKPKEMYAVLERWTHLARINGKQTEKNPDRPVFLCEHDELEETEIRDSEGRLVFVDEDGDQFVRDGKEWVEVEVTFSHSVIRKEERVMQHTKE